MLYPTSLLTPWFWTHRCSALAAMPHDANKPGARQGRGHGVGVGEGSATVLKWRKGARPHPLALPGMVGVTWLALHLHLLLLGVSCLLLSMQGRLGSGPM